MRERDIVQRIEREQAEAARRIQSTFADVERRQVEQLERVLERAAGTVRRCRGPAVRGIDQDGARGCCATALAGARPRGPDVRPRRRVAAGRAAGAGRRRRAVRLEKKLAQVAAGLERQRDEFVAVARAAGSERSRRSFRARLSALAAEEKAERAALEARLQELARRIDETVARAEERLDSLTAPRVSSRISGQGSS